MSKKKVKETGGKKKAKKQVDEELEALKTLDKKGQLRLEALERELCLYFLRLVANNSSCSFTEGTCA
jgi:hypothetical protein